MSSYIVPIVGLLALLFVIVRYASGGGLPSIDTAPDAPISFGWKMSWLAFPCDDLARGCAALAVADPRFADVTFRPCNWGSGLARILAKSTNREVFVTPPVDGWILVANWQPADELDVDGYRDVLEQLSARHGCAAAFASHRGVSLASYAFADDGVLVRCLVSVDGETPVDFGEPLSAERERDLLTWGDAAERSERNPELEEELFDRVPDEEIVLELAGELSIDPSTLEERTAPGLGRIGRPS